ncbi:uncharacterized protein MELLADRAFT_72888 [Melampsora larici-populina 98AG31]|uniref:Uncharacterized protein n=1 Tax=Melampsora larici-populina (strain 98AG31 / pathotype 3-4-7) TaxID=747676 RepID=F4S0A6_MELLP|nr:uncharacterized protein MELLADRAFT_72888 [Melampsora larici-populina 98AG31]EGG01972.1 hypothetical protein MELLADRAFT_72888 [Melampsora larici-populina 98AG31]
MPNFNMVRSQPNRPAASLRFTSLRYEHQAVVLSIHRPRADHGLPIRLPILTTNVVLEIRVDYQRRGLPLVTILGPNSNQLYPCTQ